MAALLRDHAPSRLAAGLAGAVFLHAAVGALATFIARAHPRPTTATIPPSEAAPGEIDIEQLPGDVSEGKTPPNEGPPETAPRIVSRTANIAPGGGDSTRELPEDTAPGEGYAIDPSRGSEPKGATAIDLGVAPGNWSRWVDPLASSAPPSDERPRTAAPASTTGGLAEALEAHDQALGLGPAGAVLSAAREAGHSEDAPALGTATFTITVLQTGAVRVELTGASSHVAEWRKVGEYMSTVIRRKPPHVEPPRAGVRMNIEVKAEEHWPNGAPAKSEGPALALTGSIRGTESAKEELARRNPAAVAPPASPVEQPPLVVNVEPPGVWLKGRGKVCSYQVGLTPLGLLMTGGCDPSNIGARPIRVVSTRVVSQKML